MLTPFTIVPPAETKMIYNSTYVSTRLRGTEMTTKARTTIDKLYNVPDKAEIVDGDINAPEICLLAPGLNV